MRWFRALTVCAVVVVLPLAAPGAPKRVNKPGQKDHMKGVRGVVVEFKRDGDKDNGSITVRLQHKKKQAAQAAAGTNKQRTFQVLPVTKFVRVHERKREPASFKDIREGQHVRVVPMDDRPGIARLVAILKDAR